MESKRNLLLISNSTLHGSGYLDHCEAAIGNHLDSVDSALFIPYARPSGITHDEYARKAEMRFHKFGIRLDWIHHSFCSPVEAVEQAEAIFIGGGNTFVLLRELYHEELIAPLRKRINEGMPYIGTSAGSNVAGRTIMTTNDMPIVHPPSFDAIGAVPFVINPHYLDPIPGSTHMGETRETRIKEYHVFNSPPVIGLREGAMLNVQGNTITLQGTTGARVFRQGQAPQEFVPGDSLDFLLQN